MAVKLTQGADASIVTAATRAGLATAPGDYSKTFENVAKSYEKTMEASGQIWKDVATIGTAIGIELQKNAAEWNSAIDKIYDAGGTEALMNDIYDLKDELKELGPFGGQFGDRETRRKRSEILSKRNKIFAEIDGWGEALDQASLQAEANLIDGDLMGMDKFEFVTAIVASNTSNKITGRGNYAQVSRDKTTNKLMYTMYKADGTPAVDVNGNPMTMDLGDFKQLVADHSVDNDNVIGSGLQDMVTGAENAGATYGGSYDEYYKGKVLNSLKNSFKKPIDVKRGMHASFGNGSSFKDELTNASSLSANLWASLQNSIPTNDKGQLTQTGALANIKDTDGVEGISQADINADWTAFQASILSGQTDASREMFINWAANKTESAYSFGVKQYNKKNPADKDGDGKTGVPDFYGRGKGVQWYNNQILTGSSAESFYTALRDGIPFDDKDPISGNSTNYSYQVVDGAGGWYENFEEGDTPESVQYIGSASDLASRFTKDQRFRNLETDVEERHELKSMTDIEETRIEGDYSTNIKTIDIKTMDLDDNNVADELARWLPPVRSKSNPKGYAFYVTQATGEDWSFEKGGGAMDKEGVTLYQLANKGDKGSFKGPEGYWIKPVIMNGKVIEIKTGGDLQRRRKAIEDIDALFNTTEFNNLMLNKPRIK